MDIIIADSPPLAPLSSDWAILPIALEMDPRSRFVEFFVFCPPPPPPAPLAVVELEEPWARRDLKVCVRKRESLSHFAADLVAFLSAGEAGPVEQFAGVFLAVRREVGVADDLRRVSNSEVIKYSATGFRDFTRIAASDPKVWRDIMLANREELLAQSKLFQQALHNIEQAMEKGNAQALEDMLTLASETRAHWRMGAKRK